jgi:uncharacterized membrane protein YgcG
MLLFLLLLLTRSADCDAWFASTPEPAAAAPSSTLFSALLSHQQSLLQAAAGTTLLLQAKHVKHTVLFAQAVRLLAAPALADAATSVLQTWSNLTAAAASLPSTEVAEAESILKAATQQLSETRVAMADATARWRDGTLDAKQFSTEMSRAKTKAADLASMIASADATVSFAAAVMGRVDPRELYKTLSTPLAAMASALALSTSSSAAAVLHGCPLGAEISRVVATQVSRVASVAGPARLARGLEDVVAPLSPHKRLWALTAVDAGAAMVGYLFARRAKGVAATLSAVAFGASLIVSAARTAGFDALLIGDDEGKTAAECAPSGWSLWSFGGAREPGEDEQEREGRLEARWQQVRLLLVGLGLLYQACSHSKLPLLLRLFVWPFLLFESWLAMLSETAAQQPLVRRNSSASSDRSGSSPDGTRPSTAGGGHKSGSRASVSPAKARLSRGKAGTTTKAD